MLRLLILLLTVPAFSLAQQPSREGAQAETASKKLERLLEESDRQDLARNPLRALERGDTRYAAQLGYNISDSYFASERAAAVSDLHRLKAVDRGSLPADEQVTYDSFRWQREMDLKRFAPDVVALRAVRPIEHFTGFHLDYADLASGAGVAPFKTLADYEANLERHHQYVAFIDEVIGRLRQGMARGVVQPKVIVDHVIKQLAEQVAPGVNGSVFFTPIKDLPESISEEARERLARQYRDTIRDEIFPGLGRLHDFLRDEYLPRASDSIGISQIPGGRKLYSLAIEENTTLPLSPESVHRFGLSEVDRITREMETVKARIGYPGTLHDFFDYLRTDPKFKVPSDAWVLERFESEEQQIYRHLGEQFAALPKSRLEIQAEPAYKRIPGSERKTGASGYYQAGAPDGSRPGIFFFEVATTPEMESVFLHEGVPGHHLQTSLAQENGKLPSFIRFGGFAAYDEGWALYAETLWREMGVEADLVEQFGGLGAQLTRAIRLVVDTGIHADRWSREQAIQYILDHSPAGREEAAIAVDRYIATPGQALAYQIGLSTILELKTKAKAAFGARFDPREFHRQILDSGSLPLPVLRAKLNRWIAREGGSDKDHVLARPAL